MNLGKLGLYATGAFASLALMGSPLGSAVSAFVIAELSMIVAALHRARDSLGAPRVHGALHKGVVLVSPVFLLHRSDQR